MRRLQYLFLQRRIDAELAEEIEFHRVQEQQCLEQSGMLRADAAYASRRALGNVALAREDARGVWIGPWLETIWQDLRYAGRTLVREPGFALLLGIGAGALGAAVGSQLLRSFLYGVSPLDPVAYLSAAALLTIAGAAATFVPARRAARVDPIVALRYE